MIEGGQAILKILVGTIFLLPSCQLVTKNNNPPPPAVQNDPSNDILNKMIENEILPSLSSARTSLTILDSVRTTDKTNDSLSDFVYELEKSFRSTALPKTEDSSNKTDKDYLEIELPFVVGRHNQRLLAKLSRDREAGSHVFDMFGIIPPPPTEKSQTIPLLSRMYDTNDKTLMSFWFFDMPAFNTFLKDLRDSKKDVLDPELNMQFTTFADTQELTVWSEKYKSGAMNIKWKHFHATTKMGESASVKISMVLLCNRQDTTVEFELAKNSLKDTLQDLVTNSIATKTDGACLKK